MSLKKIFGRKYILASKSERRKKLLKQIGLDFRVDISNVSEEESEKGSPINIVMKNSVLKSQSVARKYTGEIIIGADTIVLLDNRIFHKPKSLNEAKEYLRQLSGKKHKVYTGFNIIDTKYNVEIFNYEKTIVEFRKLSDDEISYYVNKYKPTDKAGAYGIQEDFGCLFIKGISGDYNNVVGMPLTKFYETLLLILK